jgi:hypothetical protein
MSKRRRVPGMHKGSIGKLHFRAELPPDASPAVRPGAELRVSAELDDCCICGAEAQFFEVTTWRPDPESTIRTGASGWSG